MAGLNFNDVVDTSGLDEFIINHIMEHENCSREEAIEKKRIAFIQAADLTDEDMAEFDDCMPDEEWWERDAAEIAAEDDDLGLMLSDKWSGLNFKMGEPVQCDAYTDYHVWSDNDGNPVGIVVDFEYAGDFHIELTLENMNRFMKEVLGTGSFPDDMEAFVEYIASADNKWQFETDLQEHKIEYDGIHFD